MGSFDPSSAHVAPERVGMLIVAIGTSAGDDDPRRDGLHHEASSSAAGVSSPMLASMSHAACVASWAASAYRSGAFTLRLIHTTHPLPGMRW